MQNYFNYFTEIEERFQQRRGSLLILSTLDWALIESWRESGIPLEAVLRGIDDAFDKYDARKIKSPAARRINGLAWCSQSVMQATEAFAEAATGLAPTEQPSAPESGFEGDRIAKYLQHNADKVQAAQLPAPADMIASATTQRLHELATEIAKSDSTLTTEELERTLAVLEEKVFSALKMATSEEAMVQIREQSSRELAPYRSRMQTVQLRQVQDQFLQKRLLEHWRLPRLSLFYMSHD